MTLPIQVHLRACFALTLLIGALVFASPITAQVPGASFRDCSQDCPEMVVIPAGSALLPTRGPGGVLRRVTIEAPLAVGKYDVTRDEFAAFVTATGYQADGCYTYDGGRLPGALFHKDANANWRHVGFEQSGRDPVVCVNWEDAVAYTKWLSQKTGKQYRLPSDEEWHYAARGGATSVYGWADNAHDHANVGSRFCCHPEAQGKDQWLYTSPVGSFDANGYGLYDMLGNVAQWTETCSNLLAKDSFGCAERLLGGEDWLRPSATDSDYVVGNPTTRESSIGFRVVRVISQD